MFKFGVLRRPKIYISKFAGTSKGKSKMKVRYQIKSIKINMTQEMIPQFFELDSLKEELKQLPHLHRVAFAASICERMLPMYSKFAQMENWGRPSLLREALDEVWLILQGKQIDLPKISQLIEEMDGENVWPDEQTEDFNTFDYLFEAQFTVSAIYSTLTALLTSDFKYVMGVVKNARWETIEGFINQRDKLYEINNCEYEMELIAKDPLAKQELAKEMEDLEKLKSAETLSPELVEWLRSTSAGKSLIPLG